MEELKQIFGEKHEEVASKIFESLIDKLKDSLSGEFYKEMQDYMYQHYENHQDRIRKKLIEELCDKYIEDPAAQQFRELRAKIFYENRDEIIASLTDDAIRANMSAILFDSVSHKNLFSWQWKDAIVDLVKKNWNLFKDDERVDGALLREIGSLKRQIEDLQQRNRELLTVE